MTRRMDRRFLAEIAGFLLLLYGTSVFVYLNGDDFMYAAFAKTGIFRNVTDYYFTGNGRYWINILDSLLLRFDRYGFLLLLPWIVLAFVVLLAKNVQRIMGGQHDPLREKALVRMGMVLFACLDVMWLRETVFWITGMMNYLFPAVVFLLGYLIFLKARAGELHGFGKGVYYIVCILAASSVEQFALMFVGMMTLHLGYDLIKKRTVPVWEWIGFGISVLALSLLILAPGNFNRVEEQNMPSFVSNVWSLLLQDTMSPVALPYLAMLSMIAAFEGSQTSGFGKIYHCAVFGGILLIAASPFAEKAVVLVLPIVFWGIQMVLLMKKGNMPIAAVFLCVVGIGSQVMLLISAVWGFRCMFSLYMVYMLLIGCLLYHAEEAQKRTVLAVGILTAIHPAAALVYIGIVLFMRWKGRESLLQKVSALLIYCGTVFSLLVLCIGYGRNASVHHLNLADTKAPNVHSIEIRELPNDVYSWYFVPIGEFHENYYRILHDIPQDTEIIYVEK